MESLPCLDIESTLSKHGEVIDQPDYVCSGPRTYKVIAHITMGNNNVVFVWFYLPLARHSQILYDIQNTPHKYLNIISVEPLFLHFAYKVIAHITIRNNNVMLLAFSDSLNPKCATIFSLFNNLHNL